MSQRTQGHCRARAVTAHGRTPTSPDPDLRRWKVLGGRPRQPSHPTALPLVIYDLQGAAVSRPAPEDEVEVRGRCSPREAPRDQAKEAVGNTRHTTGGHE